MKPQYITLAAGVPKILGLNANAVDVNISVRTDADTVELTLEYPSDSLNQSGFDVPPNPASPVWFAAPAVGANGIRVIKDPVAAIRFTKATAGTATILQQGLR